ncbi:hypothetical protein Ddye_025472 [Dipteronia dyeriana]|uniref:CCHC-type domain-containing protein n=1 Tax=Dipteronia dyeriana TaxID=168575 RepID=A0AAD9TKX7_9ROSI|nr:hypothetical protein Ddye_025472 [Dipteronia dyeriana]
MKVKVSLDISKPLKRWLRLKLSKSDEVTMVSLKYERLPEFCYACGRIGHGMKECLDEEARKVALDGSTTKFGCWLKATMIEKKTRFTSQDNGSLSDKTRSSGTSRDREVDGSVSLRPGHLATQKINLMSPAVRKRRLMIEKQQETPTTRKWCWPSSNRRNECGWAWA